MSNTIAASMDCTSYGPSNPLRARFCKECATPLASRCASGETGLAAALKFCGGYLEAGAPQRLAGELAS